MYYCHVCKKEIIALVEPIGDVIPEDCGEPLYRKQEFIEGKRTVVLGYCGPKCALDDYENTKCKSQGKKSTKAGRRGSYKNLSTTEY